MKNERGFTLIEVLSVIIIIGIIMLIAVPAVNKYIDRSNKASYASDALAYVETVRSEYEMRDYGEFLKKDEIMLVPIEYILLEKGDGSSPYAPFDFTKSYIIIVPERNGYQFYATIIDEIGVGIVQKNSNELNRDAVHEDAGNSVIPYQTYASTTNKFAFNGKTYTLSEKRDISTLEKSFDNAIFVLTLDGGTAPTPQPTENITCNNNTYTGSMQTIAVCNNGETIENAEQYKVGTYTVTCGSATKTCSISGKNRWECDNCYDAGVTVSSQIWRYYDTNGKLKTSGWVTTSGTIVNPDSQPNKNVYLIQNSKMYTGWYYYNDCRYFLRNTDINGNGILSGAMVKGQSLTINGTNYSFNANGRCYSGGECRASCNY
jgi:type IV pilus assembly protein PilA